VINPGNPHINTTSASAVTAARKRARRELLCWRAHYWLDYSPVYDVLKIALNITFIELYRKFKKK
jgi:hypothetical protein